MIGWIILGIVLFLLLVLLTWYKIVPSSEAHYVVTPFKTLVCSPDESIRNIEGTKGGR